MSHILKNPAQKVSPFTQQNEQYPTSFKLAAHLIFLMMSHILKNPGTDGFTIHTTE
jgi:hypothetical protein